MASTGPADSTEKQPKAPATTASALTQSESVEAAIPSASSPPSPEGPAAAASIEPAMRTFPAGEARGATTDYDLAAALRAINGVYYGACAVHSAGRLAITFAPTGRVKRVAVVRGDYDEATTSCITARFGAARVSPFRGGEQSVTADIVATR
jgi:hypothetical protein